MTPVRARSFWRLTARDEFARGVGTASQPARASSIRTHRSTRPAPRLACAAALASSLAARAAPADGRQDAPLTPIGCFADVVADGEHEDGYSARL